MAYVLSDEEKSDVFDVAQALGYATKWEDIHNPYLFLQALTQRAIRMNIVMPKTMKSSPSMATEFLSGM